MSLSQNCRTCLAQCKTECMISLFVETEKNGKFVTNADLLMECTSIQISFEDGYPQNICSRCMSKLLKAYKFKKECEYTNNLLKNMIFGNEKLPNDNIDKLRIQKNKNTDIIDHEYLPTRSRMNQFNKKVIKKTLHRRCNITNLNKKKIQNSKIENILKEEYNKANTDKKINNDQDDENECNLAKESFEETISDHEISCKQVNSDSKLYMIKKTQNELQNNQNTDLEIQEELMTEDLKQEDTNTEYTFKFECKNVVTKLTQRTCNYCYTAAPSFKQMCVHVFKQHKVKVTFGCTDCGEHFLEEKLFREHRNVKHSKLTQNSDNLNVVTDPYRNWWICCSVKFLNHQKLRSHVRSTHNTWLTYQCPVCNEKLQNLIDLQRHMKDSNHNYIPPAKEHLCWLCGKQYILKTDFERHMRFHSGEKPYKCNDCGKTFSSHIYLYSHKSVHNKRSRKKCNICDKSYTSSSSLKYHMKLHTGVLDHSCSVCGRLFRTKREVREHMITHTGARDHECEFCGKKFGRKRNLMTHRKIHTGERPKVCHVCGASFIQSTSLRLHMKKHESN